MTLFMRDEEKKQEGRFEEKCNIIRKILSSGKTPQEISSFCGYSLEEIEEAQKTNLSKY